MIKVERVRSIVEKKIANTSLFIADINVHGGNRIHVALDKMDGGVLVADCVMVSRHIESELNQSEEDYRLDVSSAGLDEPFKVKKQYIKNVGRQVEVLTLNGMKYKGTLLSADEQGIRLGLNYRDRHLKKEISAILPVDYSMVKHTKKVISFK